MYDLRINSARIVDGTGAAAVHGDIAVENGRIVAMGNVTGPARRTLNADGRVVSPGFVDLHTHLDVQGFWDPTLSPSPLHGVTTVVGGNCGFAVAPLEATEADYLMRMLARVEGMPLETLQVGVPWDWRTTGEFLDRLDGTLAINSGFMVGHSAMRRAVMGPAANERAATTEEIESMKALLRSGLAAGGMGFTSTWAISHSDAEGNPVPSRFAEEDELYSLAGVVAEFPGTSLEFLPGPPPPDGFDELTTRVLVELSARTGRSLNWNVLQVSADTLPAAYAALRVGDLAAERGGRVIALTMPESPPSRVSFRVGYMLDLAEGLRDFVWLPIAERLAILADPERRRELRTRAEASSTYKHLVDWRSRFIVETFSEATAPYAGRFVGEIADALGGDPFDVFMDIVLADELRTTFSNPPLQSTEADWRARAEIWRDPRTLVGASDAGAHLDMLSTFAYTTRLLEGAVRRHDVLSIEEAVQLLTSAPADLYGLVDRGRLQVGAAADLLVLRPEAIECGPVETRFDLPAGAGRLYAEADGIDHVLVNGVEIAASGSFTDERPGRMLRSGRDTRTPDLASMPIR